MLSYTPKMFLLNTKNVAFNTIIDIFPTKTGAFTTNGVILFTIYVILSTKTVATIIYLSFSIKQFED